MTSHAPTSSKLAVSALLVAALLPACKSKSEQSSSAGGGTAPVASAPKPRPRRAVLPMGETAKSDGYAMTVKNLKTCDPGVFRPKQGNINLGVEVLIENTSDKEMPINPFYHKLTDSEGYSYNISLKGCTPALKSTRLDVGEKARGWVSFEIPEEAKGLILTYRPVLGDASKFELDR